MYLDCSLISFKAQDQKIAACGSSYIERVQKLPQAAAF
jgi:hypothetical protein